MMADTKVKLNGTPSHPLKISREEVDRVEIRSDEVEDILAQMPHWTIRWGITYLFIVLTILVIMSWFIRYPDVIEAPITLTTQTPPVELVARSPGKLMLLVEDETAVSESQVLAYVQNSASFTDIHMLLSQVQEFKALFYNGDFGSNSFQFKEGMELGNVQDSYNAFMRNVASYRLMVTQQPYQTQIQALRAQISSFQSLIGLQQSQNQALAKELELSLGKLKTDSSLHAAQVQSTVKFNQNRIDHLRTERSYQAAKANVLNYQVQIGQLKARINELTELERKEQSELLISIETSMDVLLKHLKDWEEQFTIKSPIKGKVALFTFRNNNEFVNPGDEILTIIPENENVIGNALVPIAGSGKLKENQQVNIRFDMYPSQEYGLVKGKVHNISLLPQEGRYFVEIALTDGLTTSYKKTLQFRQKMDGTAEIVTEDLRLLERLFYQIREVFSNQ